MKPRAPQSWTIAPDSRRRDSRSGRPRRSCVGEAAAISKPSRSGSWTSSRTSSGRRRATQARAGAVPGLADDLEALGLEQLPGGGPESGVVVDDQNCGHGGIVARSRPAAIRLAVPFVRGRFGPGRGLHPLRRADPARRGRDRPSLGRGRFDLSLARSGRARVPGRRAARRPRAPRRRVRRGRPLLPRGPRRRGRRRSRRHDRGGAARHPLLVRPRPAPRDGAPASDQVETVLYRLVSRRAVSGIEPKRADGVVRPLLGVWREETEAYCRAVGLEPRLDSSNSETKRGLIREQVLPLLRELHPGAERNSARAARGRRPPARPACRNGVRGGSISAAG